MAELQCVAEQHIASGGECYTGRAAFEELGPEFFLESFNLQRHGGLGEVELFTRFAETEVPGDGSKDFEAEVLEHIFTMVRRGSRCTGLQPCWARNNQRM